MGCCKKPLIANSSVRWASKWPRKSFSLLHEQQQLYEHSHGLTRNIMYILLSMSHSNRDWLCLSGLSQTGLTKVFKTIVYVLCIIMFRLCVCEDAGEGRDPTQTVGSCSFLPLCVMRDMNVLTLLNMRSTCQWNQLGLKICQRNVAHTHSLQNLSFVIFLRKKSGRKTLARNLPW